MQRSYPNQSIGSVPDRMLESIRIRAISARDVHRKEHDRGRGDFRHPGIREAQVFGNPGERYGEQVCAWVVPHEGAWPTPEDVIAFCDGQIAHFQGAEARAHRGRAADVGDREAAEVRHAEWMVKHGYADGEPTV